MTSSYSASSRRALEPAFDFASLSPALSSSPTVKISSLSSEITLSSTFSDEMGFSSVDTSASEFYRRARDAHTRFCRSFSVIRIRSRASSPIVLLVDPLEPISFFNLGILAEPGSFAKVVLRFSPPPFLSYLSGTVRVFLQQGAHLELSSVHDFSKNPLLFFDRVVRADPDSCFSMNDLFLGGNYTRLESKVFLQGAGAQVKGSLLSLSERSSVHHFVSSVFHEAERTESDLVSKGVLLDTSRSLVHNLIKILPAARSSKGYEKQEALLVGTHAETEAIPDLEIGTSEVQCSHGSTVGRLDERAVFYLMSRGLSRHQAIRLILEGYFSPLLVRLSDDSLKETVYRRLHSHASSP